MSTCPSHNAYGVVQVQNTELWEYINYQKETTDNIEHVSLDSKTFHAYFYFIQYTASSQTTITLYLHDLTLFVPSRNVFVEK